MSFSMTWTLSSYKTIYKKPKRKIRSESSRDIDENDIVQWLGETFGIFRQLVAEWRRLIFVYDVKGNTAIATRVVREDNIARRRQPYVNSNNK